MTLQPLAMSGLEGEGYPHEATLPPPLARSSRGGEIGCPDQVTLPLSPLPRLGFV